MAVSNIDAIVRKGGIEVEFSGDLEGLKGFATAHAISELGDATRERDAMKAVVEIQGRTITRLIGEMTNLRVRLESADDDIEAGEATMARLAILNGELQRQRDGLAETCKRQSESARMIDEANSRLHHENEHLAADLAAMTDAVEHLSIRLEAAEAERDSMRLMRDSMRLQRDLWRAMMPGEPVTVLGIDFGADGVPVFSTIPVTPR